MAVLKNKRGISKYEYEHSFDVAYKYIGQRMNTVPNRLKRCPNTPINKNMNQIYSIIMELRTNYFPKETRNESSLKLVNSAIDGIIDLQLYFYTFWNVMDYTDRQKAYWCDLFNKEIALLYGLNHRNPLYVPDKSAEERKMFYYKNDDIKKAAFLNNMSKLHDYTHRKIAQSYKTIKNMLKLYDKLFDGYKITRYWKHKQTRLAKQAQAASAEVS